ncbi:uncharacterized protein LOC114371706 [Glycine soja]|uniref:uncharacterized protein LOC114371706 n=1 Tax=Glycine soja TaxID=3848 RepID=UPI00103DB280|nr:uncharacterized protein LOC114371706 [Glycine soja]
MVRTRGLGRALGHDTSRGMGRGDRDDSDDSPQCRRPTTSPRRQRVPVTTANDEPVVLATEVDGASIEADVYADEPMYKTLGQTLLQTQAHRLLRMSLRDFQERPELKLSSHRRKVHSLGMLVHAIDGLVSGTGLSPLIPVHVDDVVQMLVELLMVTAEATRSETAQCRGPYVLLQWCWIYENFPSVVESTADSNYDEDSPRGCMWIATKKIVKSIRTPMYRERLDRIRIFDVCWIPYREHRPVQDFHMISCYFNLLHWGPVAVYYRPERVMR